MSNGFTYFNEEWNNEPAPEERVEIITNEEREKRKQALIELIRMDEELGLYDEDYTDNPLICK
jgi:hypothetical protein